ncbi:hypothetical protein D9611_014362 [Ephemerocybe angulata]|uniref:Uncharacterized protein n=1 Tax=Ephemerocybe angulata TaxID=980116 RepID=A0A8H5EZN4_9AGAR|nr:hypothetical protein D9611_014362 [Tulosesus angulatus]
MPQFSSPNSSHDRGDRSQTTPVAAARWGGVEYAPSRPSPQREEHVQHDYVAILPATPAFPGRSWGLHEAPTNQLYGGVIVGVSGDGHSRQSIDGDPAVSHYPPHIKLHTPGAGATVSTFTSPSCAFRPLKRKATDEGPSPSVETISKHIPCRALDKDDPLMQKYLESTFDSVATATTAFFEANRFSCPVSETCPFIAGTDGNIWVHLTSEHREVSGKYKRGHKFKCPLGCGEIHDTHTIERHLWSLQHATPRYRLACISAKCKVFPSANPFYFKQHSEERSSDRKHSTGFRLINEEAGRRTKRARK